LISFLLFSKAKGREGKRAPRTEMCLLEREHKDRLGKKGEGKDDRGRGIIHR